MLTKDLVVKLLHENPDAAVWADAAMQILPKYEINTPYRIAGFFAQCGHESAGFRVLEENLFYRAETLDTIFPKYFKNAGRVASDYAKQPEKIANVIYANRMGNGDTASGEGYLFRGRGVIQLTGKENYSAFALSIKTTLPDAIQYIQTKRGALESACWFWKTRGLNAACDANDITKMTKLINGGTIGLADRKRHYEQALAIMGVAPSAPVKSAPAETTLRQGSKGETVSKLQEKLGLKSDGTFGPSTTAALKKWQKAQGLVADGIAGPKTLAKLLD